MGGSPILSGFIPSPLNSPAARTHPQPSKGGGCVFGDLARPVLQKSHLKDKSLPNFDRYHAITLKNP
jgi:hypothetical protein